MAGRFTDEMLDPLRTLGGPERLRIGGAVGSGSRHLDEIARLDPVEDHQRIVHLMTCYQFPFDITRALEMALFRTFAVPSIAALLDQTGEFYARAQKRYDDTDLIVSFLMEDGYDSEAGKAALRKMNSIHRRFEIANDDYLYVLSTFVLEPIRWIERYGWRPMHEHERLAMFHCWRAIGARMAIRDIPEGYDDFERWSRAYEREHFRRNPATERVGAACRDLFLSWAPAPLRPLGSKLICAMLDEPLLDAFGFEHPSPAMRAFVQRTLRARAKALRVLPKRRRPRIRTTQSHRSYPRGWKLSDLGPPDRDAP